MGFAVEIPHDYGPPWGVSNVLVTISRTREEAERWLAIVRANRGDPEIGKVVETEYDE